MSGLDLTDESQGHIKIGTVYTTLHRMEAKGLIISREEQDESASTKGPRRLYKATDEGKNFWKEKRKELTEANSLGDLVVLFENFWKGQRRNEEAKQFFLYSMQMPNSCF